MEHKVTVEPPVGLQASFLCITFPNKEEKEQYIKLETQHTIEELRVLYASWRPESRFRAKVELYKARVDFMKHYTEECDYEFAVSTV